VIDLSTRYLGLTLSNPLLVAASPLSEEVARIQQMANAGAAAVVLQSLFEEQLTGELEPPVPSSCGNATGTPVGGAPIPNLARYNTGPEGYLEHIRQAKAAVNIPIVASLNATSPGRWVRYAREIEAAGADALELNIYQVPTSPELTGSMLEQMYCDLVSLLKANLRIPVAVKLSPYFTSLPNMAQRLDQAGADALVLFNRFYQPDFDVYRRDITPTLELSTSQELRLRLHWVATLCGHLRADLAVTGGVHTVFDVLKALMAGAQVIMMTSALMQHGIDYLERIKLDLGRWLADNGYESVRQVQGQLSRRSVADPAVFERVNYMQVVTSYQPRREQ
jgi:dihydroorotate dehydrogenase (fumarate)